MKTLLPNKITTIEEAKAFLLDLYNNGEVFHPDDDANDLAGSPFTKEEGDKLNSLMEDIFNIPGNAPSDNMVFDPYGFILNLNPEYVANAKADEEEYNNSLIND